MRSNILKYTCIFSIVLLLTIKFSAICKPPNEERGFTPPYTAILVSQLPDSSPQSPTTEKVQESEQPEIDQSLNTNKWPSITRPGDEKDYVLGGGDVLRIYAYDEPDLSTPEIRISFDGYLNFPLLGKVKTTGLTTSELESELERLLQDGYILHPQISVIVIEYASRKVFILGAINKPGSYELKSQATLLEMISRAGGVASHAGDKLIILRAVSGESESIAVSRKQLIDNGDLSLNLYLNNNDTIYVPGADLIYIFGEVARPGPYQLAKRNRTILSAITVAGGFTKLGSPKKTRIIRVLDGKVETIHINVDDIVKKGDKEKDVELMPEDVIIVPETLF